MRKIKKKIDKILDEYVLTIQNVVVFLYLHILQYRYQVQY